MANTRQARKRARQAEKSRQRNMAQRSTLRTSIKRVLKAIGEGNSDVARGEIGKAIPVIDSMARKGIIHKNKAARHKTRLLQNIRRMQPD